MASQTNLPGGLRAVMALPRTVWLIGLISLVNDSSSEMLYPLIPLYLSSVLMAGPRALGIIEGIAEATASLLKLFSGVVVDRVGRAKPWIVFGYGLAGVGRPLIAFVTGWPTLLMLRFSDRVGKGLRSSPRDALLAASVDPSHRGLAFGLHRAMDNTGAVIGPLIAAALLAAGMPLREIFLWSVIPAVICLGLALALREPEAVKPATPPAFDWRMGDMPPAFRRYLVVVALFTLGNSSNMFLLLRARELGTSQTHVPLLWAAVSLVAAVFSTPLSALSDRLGRTRVLVAGYAAYSLFYASFGLLSSGGLWLFGLFSFYGLFMAATEGVEKALVADLASSERRGTAFGWFNLTAGLLLLPASVVFGWLYQAVSPLAAFGFSSLCAGLAALLMATWVRAGSPGGGRWPQRGRSGPPGNLKAGLMGTLFCIVAFRVTHQGRWNMESSASASTLPRRLCCRGSGLPVFRYRRKKMVKIVIGTTSFSRSRTRSMFSYWPLHSIE